MLHSISKQSLTYILFGIYIYIILWWVKINFFNISNDYEIYIFNWSYGLIPLLSSLYAIFHIAPKWGGFSSAIGKAIIFISLGLIGQWVGLQIWTYYNLIARVEIPYPSYADIGYFALIPFYTLAALMLAKASAGKASLKTKSGKLYIFVVPVVMIALAYILFIRSIGFDLNNPLKTFLDFGYPLGEIIPFAIALFILTLSRKLLGGTMRSRVLYLAFAFCFQFIAEYLFLYAIATETYTNGNINDILYASSYFIMSLGLLSFNELAT